MMTSGESLLGVDSVRSDIDFQHRLGTAVGEPACVPERVMVCMSSNVEAPRVIRYGARIAGRLGAEWYAVYVETPRERPARIKSRERDALAKNIAFAKNLGATVVRVTATRSADGLIEFARREGITRVIFGQSQRSRLEMLLRGSILNRFLREVPGAAVQIVPVEAEALGSIP